MDYSINTITGEVKRGNLGAFFRTGDWREATEVEKDNIDLDLNIDTKLAELEVYHDSDEVRILSIDANGETHYFPMTQDGRGLIAEQIKDLELQIDLGLITEAEAIFTYQNGSAVDLTLIQLKELYIEIMSIIKANYNKKIEHRDAIKALTTISEVQDYDYTVGYLVNNSYTIS